MRFNTKLIKGIYKKYEKYMVSKKIFTFPTFPCWLVVTDCDGIITYVHFTNESSNGDFFYDTYFDFLHDFSLVKLVQTNYLEDGAEFCVHERIRLANRFDLLIIERLYSKFKKKFDEKLSKDSYILRLNCDEKIAANFQKIDF